MIWAFWNDIIMNDLHLAPADYAGIIQNIITNQRIRHNASITLRVLMHYNTPDLAIEKFKSFKK